MDWHRHWLLNDIRDLLDHLVWLRNFHRHSDIYALLDFDDVWSVDWNMDWYFHLLLNDVRLLLDDLNWVWAIDVAVD
jgi:hypothetical protein